MTTKTNNRKVGNLYAGLSDIERARLLARYWREENSEELERIRNTIPDERAGRAYNEALAALRGLNSPFVTYNLLYIRTGFDRDYFAWNMVQGFDHQIDTARAVLEGLASLIAYPATQSEYAAIVKRERAFLIHVEDWADLIFPAHPEQEPLRSELAGIVREYEEADQSDETEKDAYWQGYYDRIGNVVRAAIKRGELPKPQKAPKDALGGFDGIWLPLGALSDWAYGTTEATYVPIAHAAAPALEFFQGLYKWDVRPDNEAAQVKTRREELRLALLRVGRFSLRVPEEKLNALSLEPTLSEQEWKQANDYTATLWEASPREAKREDALRSIMGQYAPRKASFRALAEAIEAVQREIFGGEDALDSTTRQLLDEAQEAQALADLSLSQRLFGSISSTEEAAPWPEIGEVAQETYDMQRPHYESIIRVGGV